MHIHSHTYICVFINYPVCMHAYVSIHIIPPPPPPPHSIALVLLVLFYFYAIWGMEFFRDTVHPGCCERCVCSCVDRSMYACTILILYNYKCSVCMSPGNQEIGSFPTYSCSCNKLMYSTYTHTISLKPVIILSSTKFSSLHILQ